MRNRIAFACLVLSMAIVLSCNKDSGSTTPPPSQQPALLLKEITVPNLPSPYYYFEYTSSGQVDNALFAGGLRTYDLVYNGNKLSEMKSTHVINKDRLLYEYNAAGKITVIQYINEDNITYKRALFDFAGDKLQSIEWERKDNAGYILERTLSFVYRQDGNLLNMTDHRLPFSGQTEASYESLFEQYDTKLNADGFSLLHDNNDHLLILPGVILQQNNPGRLVFTGTGNNYTIDYNYTYNDKNAPLTKKGDAVFTSGPAAGQRFETNAAFSYY